jgi:transposase
LRQIEVEIANGKTTPQACKETQITAQTYYRWRKEFGGLKLDQAKRLKGAREGKREAQAAGGGWKSLLTEASPVPDHSATLG